MPGPWSATAVRSVGILDTAQEENADLILIATHGHTGIKHLMLGSTAEKVVRKARCPVMTVRSDAH